MWMELLLDAIMEWALAFAPRSIRIGCTVLLMLVAIALLTIFWWFPR